MAMQSIIAASSQNDQYGCRPSCTLAFIDGQPCNTYSDSRPKFSSSAVADLIIYVVKCDTVFVVE